MYDSHSQSCACDQSKLDIVYCKITEHNRLQIEVVNGFCLTSNKANTSLVVGSCPFNIQRTHTDVLALPSDPNDVDSRVCGYTNRTGQMCGQCVDEYSLPVYSYYPQCVRCSTNTNNWPKLGCVSATNNSLLPSSNNFQT